MPRNASGTYSLPAGNPVVTGTVISSTWANTTLDDLKTEMTDSVSRSGKGGMLAPLLLVDGAVGAPALSFSSEPSSGLYRPAANELALSLVGAQRVRITPAVSAHAFTFVSPQAAAGGNTDFHFDTTLARNTGTNLLRLLTGGSARFTFFSQGDIGFYGANPVLAATTAGVGLTLKGDRNAADATSDVIVNSTVARTAGALLIVQNNGATQLNVAFDGVLSLAGTATAKATAANASLTLQGNRAAADAGSDVVANGAATRTAGSLFQVQNNGAAKFGVLYDGSVDSVPGIYRTSNANTSVTLRGNRSAADAGADVVVNSAATRTAGLLLDVQNAGTSELSVAFDGTLSLANVATAKATAANASLTLQGNRGAADAGTDVVVNSTATRTAGLLLLAQNNGSDRLRLWYNGDLSFPSGSPSVYTQGANTGLTLQGNRSAADAGVDVVLNSAATRTAGLLLDVQNNGTSQFAVKFDGTFAGPGGVMLGVRRSVSMAGDVSFAVVTATNLTGLTFSCASGKTYRWRAVLYDDYTNATVGVAFGTGAGPATSIFNLSFWSKDNTGVLNQLTATAFNTLTTANGGHSAQMYVVEGIFTTTGTGTFQLTAAAESAAAGNVIKAGSYLEWTEA